MEQLGFHGDADEMAELKVTHPADVFIARVQVERVDDVDETRTSQCTEVFLQDFEAAGGHLERIQHGAPPDLDWVRQAAWRRRAITGAHVYHCAILHSSLTCNDAATRRAERARNVSRTSRGRALAVSAR